MINKRIRNFVIIFISIVFLLQLRMCNKSKVEYQSGYNFVVSGTILARTGKITFINTKEEEVYFYNYSVGENDNISVGDSIAKAPCSKFLYIYRKNSNGLYYLFVTKVPNVNYPEQWFCN